ncbi:MAG TPA: hypothetical protein ENN99_12620 [Chloroflexi bacterium]|nr:hypothetical protein [Chloroflexota bacterium]
MTERLYHRDSYRQRFSARVSERTTWEGRPAVVLDCTAFYPESGGQPADRGVLGGMAVLDVVVRETDDAVVHVLADEWPDELLDSEVEGEIDWQRRFDHMQQHTGQHILSAAFEQLLDADTVGFHLGAESSTVDLDVARLEPALAEAVEELANQVVWADRPVSVQIVSPDELAAYPLRRPPTVEGPVRLVGIAAPAAGIEGSFDVNPCGGTHVARTGEIGLVKIVRLEHRGDETRVEFLCGERALRDYRIKNELVHRLAGMLTVGYWELDQAIERLQVEAKQLRRDLRQASQRLLAVEASELAANAAAYGAYRVVCHVWARPGKPPAEVRAVAQELMQRPGMVVMLASVTEERTHLCFARSEGVDLDAAGLLRTACAQLGGKGGGQPQLAQGSAPVADETHVQAVLTGTLSARA